MNNYNLNILSEENSAQENKIVLENMDGMYIDLSAGENDANLFFKDGTPVVEQHILKHKLFGKNYQLYDIAYIGDDGILMTNVVNNKGELQFSAWKELLETAVYGLDIDYRAPDNSSALTTTYVYYVIILKGMNDGRLRNKIMIARKDHLEPFGEPGKYINIKYEPDFDRLMVLSNPSGEEVKSIGDLKWNAIGENFELISKVDFDDVYKINRSKNGKSSNYLWLSADKTKTSPKLYNIYIEESGKLLQENWFEMKAADSTTTGWDYNFFKDTSGICRIMDMVSMIDEDYLEFIGDEYDEISVDQESEMYVAERGGKFFVINGNEVVECEDFRFFYPDSGNNCIKNFFFIYKDGYWRAIPIVHRNQQHPSYVKKINFNDEGGFESFDPLYDRYTKVYKDGKQNVFDVERGLLFPGEWFDDIHPYDEDGKIFIIENGKKYEIANVDGEIVTNAIK